MSSPPPIYLDHHSTTPCDARVVEKMLPYFSDLFGNPAAITHHHGRVAGTALEEARAAVADFFDVRPAEIYFTAGATESNNIALLGAVAPGDHVISTSIEHKSVLEPLKRLEKLGAEVTLLSPDREGFIEPEAVRAAFRQNTRLVSVMAANGEIGVIEPIAAVGELCRERSILFHTDATQAVGKVQLDSKNVDLLSMSAHKIYGPKGIGVLIARRGSKLAPRIFGGGQEKKLRSGTVNLPGVIGLAAALEIRRVEMDREASHLTSLRNRLWDRIVQEVPGTSVNGPRNRRLPGNLNVSFEHAGAEEIMHSMRHFSLSSGAACSSGDREPSYVLQAIGVEEKKAASSIRFGLGRSNTQEQMDLLVEDLRKAVSRLREISVGVR